jgi:glutamyl-Q tRNA(Asp) synthetase
VTDRPPQGAPVAELARVAAAPTGAASADEPFYRGRFAPSPTGDLHFGSLVAALGSYLQARIHHGQWLIRIEDLDPPRVVPGSESSILRALDLLGLHWDGAPLRQSERAAAYEAALQKLQSGAQVFQCSCSRSSLGPTLAGIEARYPGTCRCGPLDPLQPLAWRFLVQPGLVIFDDLLQGTQSFDVSVQTGDFVVRRRDGWWAYQLAVVVDDAEQGITQVVRGADLLDNTPRQILLQRALNVGTPSYLHLPVVTDVQGMKLSKSIGGAALDLSHPAHCLWRALTFLRQSPPPGLTRASTTEILDWACEHWRPDLLRGVQTYAEVPARGSPTP